MTRSVEVCAYKPAALMGRLANACERDSGTLAHLVPSTVRQYGHGRALCGAQPGRRSGGWDVDNYAAGSPTCIRCVSKQQKAQERAA